MNFDAWVVFSTVAFLNIISPGPAILLAISNGVSAGLRVVMVSSLGNILGLFVLSSVSMFGLGAILHTSAFLFLLIKIIGAGYLVYLGIKRFISRDTLVDYQPASGCGNHKINLTAKFKEGFLIAVTNPKAILFFVALFPLFLDVGRSLSMQFMVMTLTFMGLSFISLVTYGYLGVSSKRWLSNIRIVNIFHKVTGGIFIGMGVALLQVRSANS